MPDKTVVLSKKMMKKRILSIFLAVCLIFTLLPVGALAEGNSVDTEPTLAVSASYSNANSAQSATVSIKATKKLLTKRVPVLCAQGLFSS